MSRGWQVWRRRRFLFYDYFGWNSTPRPAEVATSVVVSTGYTGKLAGKTYTFGELFAAVVDFGLPLAVRCADWFWFWFGVADADVRCAGGELDAADGAISTYDCLS